MEKLPHTSVFAIGRFPRPGPLKERTGRAVRVRLWVARTMLFCLLTTGAFLSLTSWGRSLTRSALLLPALLEANEPAPLVVAGDAVHFQRMTISAQNGPVFLDIYEPAGPAPLIPGGREAIIDVVGVGDNRNVPQLVNLSRSLAREGIVVVNVGTPALFRYQVSASDGEAIVQTFQLLEHWPGVNARRIGIIAFSAGATPACIGAADPQIRDRVAFVAILGGYFDITSLLRTLGTRTQNINGHIQPWHPIPTPLYTLASTVSSLLTPAENQLLQQAFPENTIGPPLTTQQQAQLSPSADAFYHLLEGDEPGNVEHNLAALSPEMKALLTQLSPMSVIQQMRAPIHLLHDRNDPSIPFSQSLEFAAALARLHHPYDFAAYSIFYHVEVVSHLSLGQWLGDGSKLFQTLNSILLVGS
jgi:hypothetical protein